MANFHVIAGASDTPAFPTVRRIGPTDLKDALRNGFADFWAMPSQVFFIGLIYPIAGVVLAGLAFGQNMLPLLYPLASGFALVGPIVSIGLYELSRRREQGLPTDWKYAFEVVQSARDRLDCGARRGAARPPHGLALHRAGALRMALRL
jgi:uncharacterized membrane protein